MNDRLTVFKGPSGHYSVSYGNISDRRADTFVNAMGIVLFELYRKDKNVFVEQPAISSLAGDEQRFVLGIRTLVLEGMLDVPGSDNNL